jgi:hypothetical protein
LGAGELWRPIGRRGAARAASSAAARVDPFLAGEDPRSLQTAMRAFDWTSLPVVYRRRLSQSYTAVRTYRPQPTENRVVYLRCRVRNLVHRHRPDGGWGRYVSAESFETHTIPGDHGSALHARWKPAFLEVLRRSLGTDS